jgi:hypothetical protein
MGAEDVVVVREFDSKKDVVGVEDVERRCEVGPSGKLSVFTDLLCDPICRVRHSPAFIMLVNIQKCFVVFPIFRNPPSLSTFPRTKNNRNNLSLISYHLSLLFTRWLRWGRRKR